MKKKCLLVLLAANIVLILGILAAYLGVDSKPPVITTKGTLIYTKDTPKSDILELLSAVDEEDGDVSDTLVIEKIVPCKEENLVWITCGARDRSNNIVKQTVALSCDASFFIEASENEEVFRLVAGEAENMLDSSLPKESEEMQSEQSDSEAVEVSSEENEDADENSEAEEEVPPMEEENDSASEPIAQEPTAAALVQPLEGVPELAFSSGEVKTKKGYNPAWVTVIARLLDDKDGYDTLLGTLKTEGNFDNSTPGSYDVTVYVTDSDGNESVHAPIRIIVEE